MVGAKSRKTAQKTVGFETAIVHPFVRSENYPMPALSPSKVQKEMCS
jgi:hypothetical protein